jgi:hypothetical protein
MAKSFDTLLGLFMVAFVKALTYINVVLFIYV